MSLHHSQTEAHRSHHANWLRAAVLGANDGIISTASLVLGIAAADRDIQTILATGVAGLVAGALSMAAGEYVSVSSQADIEKADLDRERKELSNNADFERDELAQIYISRGLDPDLAKKVAVQLMEHDALGSHARDELGIHDLTTAQPFQAALASAIAFATGAALPLGLLSLAPQGRVFEVVAAGSLCLLAALGALAARVGGARMARGAVRVVFWGALAMAVTTGIGHLIGATL